MLLAVMLAIDVMFRYVK
jgi:hypothetical protein